MFVLVTVFFQFDASEFSIFYFSSETTDGPGVTSPELDSTHCSDIMLRLFAHYFVNGVFSMTKYLHGISLVHGA